MVYVQGVWKFLETHWNWMQNFMYACFWGKFLFSKNFPSLWKLRALLYVIKSNKVINPTDKNDLWVHCKEDVAFHWIYFHALNFYQQQSGSKRIVRYQSEILFTVSTWGLITLVFCLLLWFLRFKNWIMIDFQKKLSHPRGERIKREVYGWKASGEVCGNLWKLSHLA